MSSVSARRGLVGILSVLALAVTFGTAVGGGPAGATPTSVEGNCLLAITPVATALDDTVNTTVTVTWSDECTNVTSYNIERSADGGATWDTIATDATFDRLLAPPHQEGSYTDANLPCGTYVYRVIAVHKPGQAPPKTSISLDSNSVVVTVSEDCGGGNTGECTQLTGALTLGYYSNKNGQATETDADFTFLNALFLRNAAGADTNFTSLVLANNRKAFASWLLNATSKNMSYMLSAQLATLELNIRHGLVDPDDVLCEVPGTPTIGAIVALAETFIADHDKVLGGDPNRVDGDALQTLINEINNNLVSVI
jgi:hypothetical protein